MLVFSRFLHSFDRWLSNNGPITTPSKPLYIIMNSMSILWIDEICSFENLGLLIRTFLGEFGIGLNCDPWRAESAPSVARKLCLHAIEDSLF
jgi:hypothetical protein